ncbi:MAG: hypothetical protein M0Z52_07330 [Actinomycetota bacterium]|nr:hypothetical protein [Actinomycetota bacterium]
MSIKYIAPVGGGAVLAQARIPGVRTLQNLQNVLAATVTTLGIAGTYTSDGITCTRFGRLVGFVYADQAGDLYIEQSADGTNWYVSAHVAVAAGTNNITFSEEVVAPLCRARYVNGASAQGTFQLVMNGRAI